MALSTLAIVGACSSTPRVPAGTAQMGDTLAALYRRQLAEPERNQFLNRARADAIAAELVAPATTIRKAAMRWRRNASPPAKRAKPSPSSNP